MKISTLGNNAEIKAMLLAYYRLIYYYRGVRCEIFFENGNYYRYSYCKDSIKKRLISIDYLNTVIRSRSTVEIL